MEVYFFIIDYAIILLVVYFVWAKHSLSIVYIPFLYLAHRSVEESNHLVLLQLLFFLLPVYYAVVNFSFLRRNIFSVLLVLYYGFLLIFTENIRELKWLIIYALWLFLII